MWVFPEHAKLNSVAQWLVLYLYGENIGSSLSSALSSVGGLEHGIVFWSCLHGFVLRLRCYSELAGGL